MTTQIDNNQELSEIRILRNKVVNYYRENAEKVFAELAELNDAELAEFKRLTNNGTLVYTCSTSEETLKADAESNNPRFKKAKKFGAKQWYTKRQEVGTAVSLVSAYSGYLNYIESKEKDAERLEKRLDNTATDFASMTPAQQKAYLERLTAMMK